MSDTNSNSMVKWSLRKEQLTSILLSKMEQHLSVQTFLLQELLTELKSFMIEHYPVDVSVHK